jgi:hypothetical protein
MSPLSLRRGRREPLTINTATSPQSSWRARRRQSPEPSRRRQPPRVTSRWCLLGVPPSASRITNGCKCTRNTRSLTRMQSQAKSVREWVGGSQMSSMYARNGEESPHTWAPLLFIAPHSNPTVMCKQHIFCAHADGPRPRAGRSAVHITASFPVWNLLELLEKWGLDSPSTLAGSSATWQLGAPELWPSGVNTCGPSAYKAGRSVTWESVLSGFILWTVRSTNPKNHTVPAQTKFGTCGRSTQQGQTVRTIIRGPCREQPSLVRTADGPAPRPGRSAVQMNRTCLKWTDFGPHWRIADSPPTRPGRSAHPKTWHFSNKLLKGFLTDEF